MIERSEVFKIATELELSPNTVEKDYVLGWMLYGINHHQATTSWVFKGGTSLKKCFFETFRFSEDLDFTINQKESLDVDVLKISLFEIAELIYEETSIEFVKDKFRLKVIDKGNGKYSAQGFVHYAGPFKCVTKQLLLSWI